ncbi:MAG: BLUF domain-containing protein [Hymenobacteraceae bacterium]|nr:BLUF domain-containing protein [Hymenobacteraceae bacterium]
MPIAYSLAYQSIPTPRLTAEALLDILVTARRFNAEHRITGLLLVGKGRVLEFLEGPEAAVRDLYTRIAHDPRHTAVTLLADGPATQREFPDWAMAFVRDAPTPAPFPGELNLSHLHYLLGREHNFSPETAARVAAWLAGA